MNDKILFFITDNYPFGYGETFIENELRSFCFLLDKHIHI